MSDTGPGANRKGVSGTLESELKASLVEDRLPCAAAFGVAARLRTGRKQVGNAANRMGIRIVDCQLGCFKVKKATHEDIAGLKIGETLARSLREACPEGSLPCASAFKIASKLKVTPKQIGDAATASNIRIVRCQLGCFE